MAQPSNSGKPRNYPLKSMVFQAYESAGVKWLPDCGTGEIRGYCECTQNTYDGKRYYAANSYGLGENVTVWTRCVAEKLVFEGMRVVGVEALRMPCGERARVIASREVIVCSGVQGSAKLLLLRYGCSFIALSKVLTLDTAGSGQKKSSQSTTYHKCWTFQ